LTQLRASNNQINSCLDFGPPLCTAEKAWSSGHQAIGSLMTSADLQKNCIEKIDDLCRHKFLEILLLGSNMIAKIEGLKTLVNLKVLDLSYNKIRQIEGLSGLNIQELNLRGNLITDVSGLGVSELPHLTALDVAENKIKSLKPLEACDNLLYLDVRDNRLDAIRQVEFLKELKYLEVLYFLGNPGSKKPFYRGRIIFRLPKLGRLDFTKVTAEETVKSCNLYPYHEAAMEVGGCDLEQRKNVFSQFIHDEEYVDFNPQLDDEELELTLEELISGESEFLREEKLFMEKAVIREEAEILVDNILSGGEIVRR
jgi:hypothetical protein